MKNKLIILLTILLLLVGCSKKEEINNKPKQNLDAVVGTYIADGTQICLVDGVDENGNTKCKDPNPSPYIIKINEDSTYTLTITEFKSKGTIEYSEKTQTVYFNTEDSVSFNCSLVNNEELHCKMYAKKFIKDTTK